MPIEIKMPALSPTMEKGTLAKWLVAVGDTVKSGDMLAEIETDKATMEFEAVDEGRIISLAVAEGADNVPVGTVIAMLGEEGEEIAAPVAPVATTALPAVSPAAVESATSTPVSLPAAVGPAPAPAATLDSDANASPLAKRIAAANDINLSGITGTGVRGKIMKADLGLAPRVAAMAPAAVPQISAAMPVAISAPPPPDVPFEATKLSSMRKTIASRLTQSKQTVPHFYLTARCNLDALLNLRKDLNAGLAARNIKLSVNDMLIKAMAIALTTVPEANVQFGGDTLYSFSRVDIAMAVAIDGGLITPVIKDVGALSLSGIAQQTQMLAAKARDGKLMPEDYQGGTASISNLGMFGIDEMFPVLNPPQALILGVGAGIEQPWKVDGTIGLATIMAATASFDHRAIDGAIAARFMAALRDAIENPIRIIC